MGIPDSLHAAVRERAADRCEYCLIPTRSIQDTFHVDHIVAQKHRGATVLHNLALSCSRCNQAKGTDLAGIDPQTNVLTRLFNPRSDVWAEHFRFDGGMIVGTTDIGRTTAITLAMNHPDRVALRQLLIELGDLGAKNP